MKILFLNRKLFKAFQCYLGIFSRMIVNFLNLVVVINNLADKKGEESLVALEEEILSLSLQGKTYKEMQNVLTKSDGDKYSLDYLKQSIGPKLWKKLSKLLNDDISKGNIQFKIQHLLSTNSSNFSNISLNNSKDNKLDDRDNYVDRPPNEEICLKAIEQPGIIINIRAAPKMGKTWFMQRIIRQSIKTYDYNSVYLNLYQVNNADLKNLDSFLIWFCHEISLQSGFIDYDESINYEWNKNITGNVNCTDYLRKFILPRLDKPLIIGLDNIDELFNSTEISIDFFKLIRSWHDYAQSKNNWGKFKFIMTSAREPDIPLDINFSPFNVGLTIDLPDFSYQQVEKLIQLNNLEWESEQITDLFTLVGGHPAMIQQAIDFLNHPSVEELSIFLDKSSTEEGIYRNFLKSILRKISIYSKNNIDLIPSIKKLISSDKPVEIEYELSSHIYSLGLVNRVDNKLKIKCELYRDYFKAHLR